MVETCRGGAGRFRVNPRLVSGGLFVGLDRHDLRRAATAELGLFGLMLCLAASNRLWLVPALAKAATISQSDLALARLRRNILAEQILGVLVVGIVGLLGTLSPAIQGS